MDESDITPTTASARRTSRRRSIAVADTFAAEEAARRIATEHPEVHFFFGSALGPAQPNASVFDSWLHEAAFLAGMAAGFATRSHRIGVVAAMPGPETNRMLTRQESIVDGLVRVPIVELEVPECDQPLTPP